MNKLYVITGPAGVGKSTISSGIAARLEKSCLIEGDDVYHLVKGGYVSPWLDGNHLDLFWDNSISLISNSLSKGYDVVFNYILDTEDINFIKNKFLALIKFSPYLKVDIRYQFFHSNAIYHYITPLSRCQY